MYNQIRVLVVDDMETMRKVTAAQLASVGIEHVELARDGAEALKLLQSKRFDIVVSDLVMPVMSGMDLLRAMRSQPKLENLPFIIITAEAARSSIEDAVALGISDLLVKPYTANRLLQGVKRAMQVGARRQSSSPAAVASRRDAVRQPHLAEETTQATLLLVDDTADNLHLLAEIFKGSYRIRAAHHGQKALDICFSDNPPDLVLLDVMMPGMDGFEVARRMREHPNAEGIPIIFVTALTDESAKMKGMELGAVDFISKPLDPVQLKLRVNNFMRYVALRKQLQADYDNLLETARLRDDMDTMMRHDIKGPLTGAMSTLQLLLDDADTTRRQGEQLRLAGHAILQVMEMINLSTELLKIETGRFTLDAKPLPIGDMLRRIVEMARTTYSARQLVIAVDADVAVGSEAPQAAGDAMLTYSLLNNLLKNACEAAPIASRVSVTLSVGDALSIAIRNQGVVPEEIRERLFQKHATYGKPGGSGLGTYSAKLLANAQCGDVSFAVSDQDDTSTFLVTLPKSR